MVSLHGIVADVHLFGPSTTVTLTWAAGGPGSSFVLLSDSNELSDAMAANGKADFMNEL